MNLPKIGITMGDPTGIGPEIIVKALSEEETFTFCKPFVFGDKEVILKTIRRQDFSSSVEIFDKIPDEGYSPKKIYLFPSSQLNTSRLIYGRPDRECGRAMAKYIEDAVKWIKNGWLDAITTCPINKESINAAGFSFPGHTEFIAHLTGVTQVAMMFMCERWRIVLVTTHLSLKEVSKSINKERVLSIIRITNEGLKRFFNISNPKIAVLGLNPHCGEGGLLGDEERQEIIPAIEEARKEFLNVEGPFAADSFFNISNPISFDAIISMYHDQGLIPIKMLDFKGSVNITLGLPFIRTSVSHGTAYDIAGKGIADPTNLVKALRVASNLSKITKGF